MVETVPLPDGVERERDADWLRHFASQVREMPYLEPPERLLPAIMGAVRGKRFPWWYRLLRWARSPHSLTFTPLQGASFGLVVVLLSLVSAWYLPRSAHRDDVKTAMHDAVPVTLTLSMPEARSVAVVGTFNEWQETGYEMTRDASKGTWNLILRLPDGRYEYAFVLDGHKIIPDPKAEFLADDGFGNRNAVLIVGRHHDEAI